MRIVSFRRGGKLRFGVKQGDGVREAADPSLASPLQLIGRDIELGQEVHALEDLDLLPPVPQPGKIVCLGLNYAKHAEEGGNPIPSYPALFLRTTTSLAAHGKPILRPACSEQLDYEAELAVVMGVGGRDIPESSALAHVAGYACFNDGSVRDYQRKSTQWTAGKNFDSTGGFGPELVTGDELPAGAQGLRISSRLNGKLMQDGNTADMIFSVARTIAIVSEAMTLEPGDVIITGTPSGVGYARKPPVFMRAGDLCEVEIEGVGTLRNPIADA